MSITIKSRKAKARRLQNWVAQQVSDILDIPWGKDELIQGREMGQQGVDLKLYGKAKEFFPYSVECKSVEKYSIHKWMEQAENNLLENTNWLLFCKRNKEQPIVILDAKVFFDLLRKVIDNAKINN